MATSSLSTKAGTSNWSPAAITNLGYNLAKSSTAPSGSSTTTSTTVSPTAPTSTAGGATGTQTATQAPANATSVYNAEKATVDYNTKVSDFNNYSQNLATNQQAKTQQTATKQTEQPVDLNSYLASNGQPNDFLSRNALARKYGIGGYVGNTQQNQQLLNILQNQPKPDKASTLMDMATTKTVTPSPTTEATKTEPVKPATTLETANKEIQNIGQEYLNKVDDIYTKMTADLEKVRNGTFPLSVADQTVLNETQKAIERQKQSQIDANDTYQKAVQVAGISSGRQRYAPELQAGNLANAVNWGIQKIADIESEGALTMAKLKQSIDDKNYKMVKDYYTDLQTVLKDKTTTLMQMQQAVINNEKDLRDYNYKVAQDALAEVWRNKNFTFQEKQAAAENLLNSQKFEHQKDIDLKNYNLKVQQENLPNILASLPAVSSINGTANSIDQEKFLSQLDPDTAALVKAVANYDEEPEIAGKRSTKGLNAATLTALALRYNPNYSPLKYDSIKKYKMDLSDGTRANKIISLNTSINHLSDFQDKANGLAEVNYNKLGWLGKSYSNIAQLISENKQDPRVVAYNQWKNTLASEVAGLLKGTSAAASQEEIRSQLSDLENTVTPAQADTIVQNYGEILAGRLLPLYDEYKQQTGQSADVNRFVFPRSQDVLKKIDEDLKARGSSGLDLNKLIPSAMSDDEIRNWSPSVSGTSSLPSKDFFQIKQ